MEPKALAALSAVGGGGGLSGTSATDPASTSLFCLPSLSLVAPSLTLALL